MNNSVTSVAIKGQRFDATGQKVGGELAIGAGAPQIASDTDLKLTELNDGRVAVAYYSGNGVTPAINTKILDPRDSVINGTADADLITSREEGAILNGFGGGDTLIGRAGDDILRPGAGDDTVRGEGGVDTVDYSTATARVSVALDSTNMIGEATGADIGNDFLFSIENVVGGAGNDFLIGSRGNNVLIGGAGADFMIGLTGDDNYEINDTGDVVTERVGEGDDVVYASINFDIPENVEVLIMTGGGDLRTNGTANRDIIEGNAGDNYINGAGGFDVMRGGLGDDTYSVDNIDDAIVEISGGGEDIVYSSIDFQLSENLETLVLRENALIGFGSDGDNRIFGDDGTNVLFGRGGTDYLEGLGGDDIFVITPESGTVDVIGDFENGGAGSGDRLSLAGFGQGATLTQLSQTSFEVSDISGAVTQQFVLLNHDGEALVLGDDFYFS